MAKKQKEAPFIGNWNDTKAAKTIGKKTIYIATQYQTNMH